MAMKDYFRTYCGQSHTLSAALKCKPEKFEDYFRGCSWRLSVFFFKKMLKIEGFYFYLEHILILGRLFWTTPYRIIFKYLTFIVPIYELFSDLLGNLATLFLRNCIYRTICSLFHVESEPILRPFLQLLADIASWQKQSSA